MHRRLLFLFALLAGLFLTVGFSQTGDQISSSTPAIANDAITTSIQKAKHLAATQTSPDQTDRALNPNDAFAAAMTAATQAAQLSQMAQSPDDWDQVAQQWTRAITQLQSIPAKEPQRVYAQRKIREYLQNLTVAQQQAEKGSFPRVAPSFGSPSLNEQLVLYRSYLATMGLPDVLIVGSSRSLQGVDPQVLQQELARQGYSNARVYNFGIHGATAQVIDVLVRQILTPEQLPKLVLWPEGSRAFNSGRPDRTYDAIVASAGYQALGQGETPEAGPKFVVPESVRTAPQVTLAQADVTGFVPVLERFDPAQYYRQHPRVAGLYDADYYNFDLSGKQRNSLQLVAQHAQTQGFRLVYINLPLTQDYLDPTRSRYEQQYRQWMQTMSQQGGFQFVNLQEPALSQNGYFADPSHINRFGAAAIARRLATHPGMPWSLLREDTPSRHLAAPGSSESSGN